MNKAAVLAILEQRRDENMALVAVILTGQALGNAASWYLEEGSQEAREALTGAAAAWETL